MPLRLNDLPHAAAPRAPVASEVETAGANPSPFPTRKALPHLLQGLQRRAKSAASCFGIEKQPSAYPESGGSAALTNRRHVAQMDAAIDRWAQTQASDGIADACINIKRALSPDTGKAGLNRATTRETLEVLDLEGYQLTSLPAELGQAAALQRLNVRLNQLTSFPPEMGQAMALRMLDLHRNQLTSFPGEMGKATALQTLWLGGNQLTSFPGEMGQATALQSLYLGYNQLTSFPAEMGHCVALETLDLCNNQLTSFPAEMGQATALQTLSLDVNQLIDLPVEIAQLPRLRYLGLSHNRFTVVPRALLDLPPTTEINLQNNPLPDAEILAVRQAIAQRRAAGQTVPMLILPPLAEAAGQLRVAAANDMNVHTGVLTDAFKKRLDDVALQFPEQLSGNLEAQRAQMKAIALRLTQALDTHAADHTPDPTVLGQARNTADLMFRKGQGEEAAYVNDFHHSAGHVLAYTFLALEAQWTGTPAAHQPEARCNGMTALINALESGAGMCDTRLCEEVMQTIGLPLSDYAQANPDIVDVTPPPATFNENRDVTLSVAKQVLDELLKNDVAPTAEVPPPAWRATLLERMQRDHPKVPLEQVEKCVHELESMWQTFHDLVLEQRDVAR